MNLYPSNPAEEIEELLNNLDLAARLQIGLREGFINPLCFSSNIGINYDTKSILKSDQSNTNLKNRFKNLVLAALCSAACGIDRALDNKFSKKKYPNNYSEINCLRNIIYMIRCAFAHDPCDPKWCCRPQYCKSPYSITIETSYSNRVTFANSELTSIKYELDFNILNSERLNISHFNGLDGFFLLGEYAKKIVE